MGMDYNKFYSGIEDIFATFGKKLPEERIVEAIYKRIKDLPDSFMVFAVKHFEDQEKLPQNLGRYMFCELWPDFLDQHPELRAGPNYSSCPKCKEGMPGMRKVWKPETVLGEQSYSPILIRCACGNAPNPKNEQLLTDEQILEMGWRLDNPFAGKYSSMPYGWKKVIGVQEEIRPEHKACIAEMNGEELGGIVQNSPYLPF